MTRRRGRPTGRPGGRSTGLALTVLAFTLAVTAPADAAAASRKAAKAPARPAALHRKPAVVHTKAVADDSIDAAAELSFSDEFERAELIERMLNECRGIAYNAYELAQSSGEALKLPAPIQLVTVRVRHPYCAELLRTYAPKTRL